MKALGTVSVVVGGRSRRAARATQSGRTPLPLATFVPASANVGGHNETRGPGTGDKSGTSRPWIFRRSSSDFGGERVRGRGPGRWFRRATKLKAPTRSASLSSSARTFCSPSPAKPTKKTVGSPVLESSGPQRHRSGHLGEEQLFGLFPSEATVVFSLYGDPEVRVNPRGASRHGEERPPSRAPRSCASVRVRLRFEQDNRATARRA
jgi:hypothetical protein